MLLAEVIHTWMILSAESGRETSVVCILAGYRSWCACARFAPDRRAVGLGRPVIRVRGPHRGHSRRR
jgi:hypothetical protein